MTTMDQTPHTLEKAISFICQLEEMLAYVIKHSNEDDETKTALIVTKQCAKSYVEEIERELARQGNA
ncbi:hypothetical protein [Halodesulfovibrio aestuarii]|uniref:Uncharacterized protein n=1 Tax=Halodesulfovibrio aestuarii TaxID=126333 RepID=A0ABV4JQK5_9BACT